jgi:hypothetical protein
LGPNVPSSFEIDLFDISETALSDVLLPLTPPNLADFGTATFRLIFEQGVSDYWVEGNLTSLSAVPEPGTLFLMGSGMLGALLGRRRRRRKVPISFITCGHDPERRG